jgi:hypothetical protein
MKLHLFLLPILGVLLYGWTLPFPFVFDDYIYLVDNPLVKESRSFTFMGDFRAFANHSKNLGLDPDLSTNFILRPVAYGTFHLNYLLGGMNPAGFRLLNIAIHCANALLLFELVARLLRAPRNGGGGAPDSALFIALVSSLLFLVHPLQIESVTYVIQRFTSFGTMFYLFTVLMFVVARTSEDPVMARRCRCFSVGGLLVGMFVKEFLFTAPFVMVLLDWLVLRTPVRDACRRAVPWLVCMPIIPVLIIVTSAAQNEGGASFAAALNVAAPQGKEGSYAYHYALTQPGVVLTYLRLILLPRGLNIDPDHPLSTSVLEWRVLGPVGLLVAIIVVSWAWYSRGTGDARRSLAFCSVLWFFITISIDSSIVPLPDLMSEHRSHLPSVGIFMALACMADMARTQWMHRPRLRVAVPAVVSAWILALGVATVFRNQVWSTEVSIWADAVAKSPNKPRPWNNLGTSQHEAGDLAGATASFRRAIELEPRYVDAYQNLALNGIAARRYREALEAAQAGLRIAPDSHKLHYVLGLAYCGLEEGEKALAAFGAAQSRGLLTQQQQAFIAKAEAIVGRDSASQAKNP